MKRALALLLLVLGFLGLLLSVFSNFLWVEYFSARLSDTNKPFEEMAVDALPFFLVAVIIGIAFTFLNNNNKKDSQIDNQAHENDHDASS